MSLVRKIAVGLAAGGGVLLAVSPASAASLPSVDSIGEGGNPNTVVQSARQQFQDTFFGVQESAGKVTGGIGG